MQRRLLLLAPLAAVAPSPAVIAATSSNGPGPRGAAALVDPGGKPRVPKRPNVVLIVMDEFPGDSLLGPDRRIDAVCYPNLAAPAGNATWFPNAFTRYDFHPEGTTILDGRRPFAGEAADQRDHRRTIFDLFGRRRLPDPLVRGGHRDLPAATARAPARAARGSCAIRTAAASGSTASSPR